MSCLMHQLGSKEIRKPAIGDTLKFEAHGHSLSIYRVSQRSFRIHYKGPGTWWDLWARDWHEAWTQVPYILPSDVLFKPMTTGGAA